MALQFQPATAGKGMRIGEEQGDAFIQYGAIGSTERAVMGIAGFGCNAQNRLRDSKRTLTGYANNTHAATTGRSGNSSDGVLMYEVAHRSVPAESGRIVLRGRSRQNPANKKGAAAPF